MKANELRIGNWVEVRNVFESPIKLRLYQRDFTKDFNDFEPIPLTEEILLKCGFECIHKSNKHYIINDPNGYKDLFKISIFPTINEQWQIAFSDELNGYKDYSPTTKLKYLHQLQNLYFALTGEELEIKL